MCFKKKTVLTTLLLILLVYKAVSFLFFSWVITILLSTSDAWFYIYLFIFPVHKASNFSSSLPAFVVLFFNAGHLKWYKVIFLLFFFLKLYLLEKQKDKKRETSAYQCTSQMARTARAGPDESQGLELHLNLNLHVSGRDSFSWVITYWFESRIVGTWARHSTMGCGCPNGGLSHCPPIFVPFF